MLSGPAREIALRADDAVFGWEECLPRVHEDDREGPTPEGAGFQFR